jgi:uncharacterized peroxidase-related enzyme
MTKFTVHTIESAPEGSQAILKGVQQSFGFLPNLMTTLSESPAMLEGYATIAGIFDKSDFTPTERQIVLMTNNRLNSCNYCMTAHTTLSKMQGVSNDVIEALRIGSAITDPKMEALRVFSAKINEKRGEVTPLDVDIFLAAGYNKANVLEVILGTAQKVMSNYTNHVAKTPIDDAFKADLWPI